MRTQHQVIPKLDLCLPGPYKQWKSIRQIRVYHYDVQEIVKWLFLRSVVETMRTVCVEIEFQNGATYSSHGLFRGDDASITTLAIERALKEFSRRGCIAKQAA